MENNAASPDGYKFFDPCPVGVGPLYLDEDAQPAIRNIEACVGCGYCIYDNVNFVGLKTAFGSVCPVNAFEEI